MQGHQLFNFVAREPGGDPVPKVPRPKGLFDHICFANATGLHVPAVHLKITGASTFTHTMAPINPVSVGVDTLNVNQGQMNYVSLVIDVGGGTTYELSTFAIHDLENWHLGRVQAGLSAAPDGTGVVPYAVLTLFPDDMSDKIYVQAVPHDAWK